MSPTPKITIVLINHGPIAHNAVGSLTGQSGLCYAQSTYEDRYGGHVARVPLERWREIKKDIAQGMQRRYQQWEVDVEVEMGEEENAQRPTPNAQRSTVAAAEPVVEVPVEIVEGFEEARRGDEVALDTVLGTHTAESLAAITSFKDLQALAVEVGVANPQKISSKDGLRTAILATQLATA